MLSLIHAMFWYSKNSVLVVSEKKTYNHKRQRQEEWRTHGGRGHLTDGGLDIRHGGLEFAQIGGRMWGGQRTRTTSTSTATALSTTTGATANHLEKK